MTTTQGPKSPFHAGDSGDHGGKIAKALEAANRLHSADLTERSRMRTQFGASHERIEQTVKDGTARTDNSIAGAAASIIDHGESAYSDLKKQLNTMQRQLAYIAGRPDFDPSCNPDSDDED